MAKKIFAFNSLRKICHGLIWMGCILAGLSMALPLVVTRPLTGISPKHFVIHQNGTYYQVAAIRHGHQTKWTISRRQYRQVEQIGETATAGVIIGTALFAIGCALLLFRSARQRRRLRLAQSSSSLARRSGSPFI